MMRRGAKGNTSNKPRGSAMAGKIGKWQDLRKKKFSPEEITEQDAHIEKDLLEMSLREVREMAGKTQADVAKACKLFQAEVSRLEKRSDMKLSTVRKFIESINGEVDIFARFGDKFVRLKM